MKLRNLKKAPFEIATLLAGNLNIVRLIYDDSPSVLVDKKEFNLSVKDLIEQDYIGFYPATESGIKEIDKKPQQSFYAGKFTTGLLYDFCCKSIKIQKSN
jgi:hypothetical protein